MTATIQLNNGIEIPREGLGTYQLKDLTECKRVVLDALENGYRLIDTSQVYHNEAAVGAAIRESAVAREQVFVTTKVWLPFYGDQVTMNAVKRSLSRMGLDYLDLVLLHEPYGDYYGAYRALERLQQEGLVRAIGVSNFDASQLLDLSHHAEIPPAVNQVEFNVYQQQVPLRRFQRANQIALEAWAPLGEVQEPILQEPLVHQLATKYHKTPGQILLRFLTQQGAIVIPKAAQHQHLMDNIRIWDFTMTPGELGMLAKLDKGRWLSPDRRALTTTQHYMDLIDQTKNQQRRL